MAPLPPSPKGLDLHESRQRGVLVATFLPWSVAFIAVVLRFACRKASGIPLWLDDYFIVPAFILVTIACFATSQMMIPGGIGLHIWAVKLTNPPLELFWQGLFINQATYALTIGFVKASVLCLYWRLFKLPLRWWIWGLGLITLGWTIGLTIATFLLCTPLDLFWNKTLSGHCLNQFDYSVFSAIPNFLTDVALLVLPLPLIWKLHTSQSHKMLLSAIFVVGYFVAGVSIARFVVLYRQDNYVSPDITWNGIDGHNWTIIELNCAVISACLPTFKPILSLPSPLHWYSYLTSSLLGSRSGTKSKSSNTYTKNTTNEEFSNSQVQLREGKFGHWDKGVEISRAKICGPERPMRSFERLPSREEGLGEGVRVESEVDVSWQSAAARKV